MIEQHDLVRALRRAVEAVDDAKVPDDLRSLAFERALDAVGLDRPAIDTEAPPLERIATSLSVPPSAVARVYEADEGGVRLAIRRTDLPRRSSRAWSMRAVAILLAVGRQVSGTERQTPLAVVRTACTELGVLDPANFSAEINGFGMTRGQGSARTLKAGKRHHDEAARLTEDIARRIGG